MRVLSDLLSTYWRYNMNQYFHSTDRNKTIAVRLNGIPFAVPPDYERVPSSATLRGSAERGTITTYLPQVTEDKTTGYRKLFFTQL
jgi:hypothetical protein